MRESTLEAGERVLVRNLHFCQKQKLSDQWGSKVYILQKRAGDLPVNIVHPEGQDGPTRTLHRASLLPCGFLSETMEEIMEPKQAHGPRTRQTAIQSNEQPLYSKG